MNIYFTTCNTLNLFTLFLFVKTISTANMEPRVKFKSESIKFKNYLLWVTFFLVISRLRPASTLIRFQTKTELFCSGYGYRPHYNAENDHRKRSHSKTLSRVERAEYDAFWKRCFLVWTDKTMLSENCDVIKIETTGRHQTTRPWVSKMGDRRYHVASLFSMRTEGLKNVFKTDTAL